MNSLTVSEPDLTPVWIEIFYDRQLQTITGRAKDHAMVNRGCLFMFVLQCFLMDHPEIEFMYPPGKLGFSLNGCIPEIDTPLEDGDRIHFMAADGHVMVVQ